MTIEQSSDTEIGSFRILGAPSVGTKILGLVCFCLVLLGVVATVSIWEMDKIGHQIEGIATRDIPLTDALTRITVQQREQTINFERAIRAAERMHLGLGSQDAFKKALGAFDALTININHEISGARALLKKARERDATAETAHFLAGVTRRLDEIAVGHIEFDHHSAWIFSYLQAGTLDAAQSLIVELRREETKLDASIEALRVKIHRFTSKAAMTANDYENSARILIGMFTLAALILGLGTAILLVRRNISLPLSDIVVALQSLTAGDTSREVRVYADDEIGAVARAYRTYRDTILEKKRLEGEQANQERKHLEVMKRIAYFDELTQLRNRRCCIDDMEERLDRKDDENSFALLHLDLDNFKRVNDSMGHAAGDRLLNEVGRRLRLIIEETKIGRSYRWGDDEFVTLITSPNADVYDVCRELTDILSIPVPFGKAEIHPSASLGVARYPDDGATVEELMIHADIALYKAKERGKDGFHFFTKEMKDKIDRDAEIEQELRGALENDQFFAVFQPQVDMATLTVTGIEALVRWQHPEKGILNPGQFLAVAEANRLSTRIGRQVFDQAFAAAKKWLDADIDFGRMAVNLSPQDMELGTVFDDLTTAMDRNGLSPEYVSAEIVESVLLEEHDTPRLDLLERLRSLGIKIELDDFGTGYAALHHLASLPVTGVKVDRSFTSKMLQDEKKSVVISSLITMAKLLKLDVVIEGIETDAQMAKLQEMGYGSLQGYLIAKPMPFKEMTEWLESDHISLQHPVPYRAAI